MPNKVTPNQVTPNQVTPKPSTETFTNITQPGQLDDCGCGEALGTRTPIAIFNRPGLSAIAYRVGTHALFKQGMLARLSAAGLPALAGLRTRDDDDFSIALLDAWAVVADVLTFYQERIANESYLRTAVERLSVLELARLIGYELRPGVAASAYLAFTLETAPGAPTRVALAPGVRTQSVPGPGEQPATFETIEAIEARPAWNALKVRTVFLPDLTALSSPLYFTGIANNLQVGDALLLAIAEPDDAGAPSHSTVFYRVTGVTLDHARQITQVDVDVEASRPAAQTPFPWQLDTRYAFGLFAQLPSIRSIARDVSGQYVGKGVDGSVYPILPPASDSASLVGSSASAVFAALSPDPPTVTIDPHAIAALYQTPAPLTDPGIQGVLLNQVWDGSDLEVFAQVQGWSLAYAFAFVTNYYGGNPDAATPDQGVFAFRTHASLFGHNAPNWQTVPAAVRKSYGDPDGTTLSDWPDPQAPANQLDLDLVYRQIVDQCWVVVQRPPQPVVRIDALVQQPAPPAVRKDALVVTTIPVRVPYPRWREPGVPSVTIVAQVASNTETGIANYMISAKVSRLQVTPVDSTDDAAPATISDLRETTVYGQSEQLTRAGVPIDAPLAGSAIDLDGLYDGMSAGQAIVVSGARADLPGVSASEVATIGDVLHDLRPGGVTWLKLKVDLSYQYDRATVSINANVALATHGETKQEPLGSGDASQSYQRFTLAQSPLTYIGAPTPSGTESTLAVRVNDILWHGVPTLYGQGPRDRVFVTHTGDDATTTVEFGDGKTGARLPTGQENIQATYRKGIGLAGQVKAGQIKLLLSAPLGVKSVVNPRDAAGAADPQSRDDARAAAPLTVLTLDRIVSLEDYQDFAQSYAGIAKALATWTWDGQKRGVFVTVAGPAGARVDESGTLYTYLLEAMHQAAEPYIDLRVRSYRPAFFRLGAWVKVDPDYLSADVLAQVEAALRTRFAFAVRAFGQGVALSEVVAVMQAVPGVVAVDLDLLYRSDEAPALKSLLGAAAPQAGGYAGALGAELLTLDPAPLDHLGVMA